MPQISAGRFGAGGMLAIGLSLAPAVAGAQSIPSDRIDAIERQIKGLQSELQKLKSELGEARQQVQQSRGEAARAQQELRATRRAAAAAQQDAASAATSQAQAAEAAAKAQAFVATPPPPAVPEPGAKLRDGNLAARAVQTPGNRFGIESADGRNSIFLTGRVHFDSGDYIDYTPQSRKFSSVQELNSGFNARRARLGVTGKFDQDWVYSLIYDFGGSNDSGPGGGGITTGGIQTAQITYNGFNKGPLPLAFDIGYMDTPFTLQEAMSSNDLLFVERASIQAIASNIFANDFRSAIGVRSNDDRYWVGTYVTGPQSGALHSTSQQIGAFGRATFQVLQTPEYSVHLGGDVGGLIKPPSTASVRTITLSDRPEDRVDPTSILSTGSLGTPANPVNNAAVYGLEAAGGYENFFVEGEYYHIDVDRRGLATNGFDGGYVEGSWIITGEHRNYIPAAGAYSGVVPAHRFSPWDGDYGFGAIELVARYSRVNLDDNFIAGLAPAPGGNAVGGGTQDVYGVGVNWYPNANIRFMFDYLHADINKRFSTAAGGGVAGTPLGTPIGGHMDAVVLRSQFAF